MKSLSPLEQTYFLNVPRILNQFYILLLTFAKDNGAIKFFLTLNVPIWEEG